jgi:signal transduction histidine kinase
MHDILSHAVSLMIVQAEAGPVTVRTDPRKAEAAFDAISEAGRDAMAQLRGMLGVLRENEAHGAPRAPQPDIGDLPALIDRVRAGGLEVSCRTEGAARALPPATGATVFRVVQEALTNVVKHAGATRASVRLRHGPGALEITVTDDGRGAAPAGGPGRTGGHGLTGIRERAAAHGGTASTGAGPGGRGFEVRVVLPLPAGTSGSAREP